jgi:hypothetical protein
MRTSWRGITRTQGFYGSGYRANFVYRILGRPLRGSLYPPGIVLYRKELARYTNEGHAQ